VDLNDSLEEEIERFKSRAETVFCQSSFKKFKPNILPYWIQKQKDLLNSDCLLSFSLGPDPRLE
jgi:hypothetical protein